MAITQYDPNAKKKPNHSIFLKKRTRELEAAPCWRRAFCPSSPKKGAELSPQRQRGGSRNPPHGAPVLLCVVTGHLAAARACGPDEDSMPGQNKCIQKPAGKQTKKK